VGVFGLYALLGATGSATFYDKLLCVPLLNLGVRAIDSSVASFRARGGLERTPPALKLPQANLAHMGLWIVFFGGMSILGKTDGRHPGDALPFWELACAEGRRGACDRLLEVESTYCGDRSAWACNELGRHHREGVITAPDSELASMFFARACELRFQAACVNLLEPAAVERTNPKPLDLRLLLREGGRNLSGMSTRDLYQRACDHGWAFACSQGQRSL